MNAKPFAPKLFAVSVSCSIWPCVAQAKPLAFSAFTTPPAVSTADRNTLNLLSLKSVVKSTNSIPNRVSGLSTPNRSIASMYGIRGNGVGIFSPRAASQTCASKPSINAYISSRSMKLISKSICVNSGCRSARKSSSRKHFANWKYRSTPATINICLNCCGDCGNAKNLPGLTRDGTRYSRAPSGVLLNRIGVSTSRKPFASK